METVDKANARADEADRLGGRRRSPEQMRMMLRANERLPLREGAIIALVVLISLTHGMLGGYRERKVCKK